LAATSRRAIRPRLARRGGGLGGGGRRQADRRGLGRLEAGGGGWIDLGQGLAAGGLAALGLRRLATSSWALGPPAAVAAARRARADGPAWASTIDLATAGPRPWPVRSTMASRSGLAERIIIIGAPDADGDDQRQGQIDSQKPTVRT
jgi:hypothetical protein